MSSSSMLGNYTKFSLPSNNSISHILYRRVHRIDTSHDRDGWYGKGRHRGANRKDTNQHAGRIHKDLDGNACKTKPTH